MKFKIIIYLLFVLISVHSKANENLVLFDSANAAYSKANYTQAVKYYETILNKGVVANELFYNLGNAYYKLGSIGKAILNYERAKKLAPDDDEITTNLKLANQKTEDKIDAAPQLFLTEWKISLKEMMSERNWSWLSIFIVSLGLFMFAIYVVSVNKVLRQLGFFGGSVLLFSSVLIFFIAKSKYNSELTSTEAIITSASVTVSGSPSSKGTKLFLLHEGTKVTITNYEGIYTEIKIANGNVGWVESKTIETI